MISADLDDVVGSSDRVDLVAAGGPSFDLVFRVDGWTRLFDLLPEIRAKLSMILQVMNRFLSLPNKNRKSL